MDLTTRAARFRQILTAALPPVGQATLLLSSGVDSLCLLAAMLERGIQVRAVTFRMARWRNCFDARVAAAVCAKYAVPCTVVDLPADDGSLIRGIRDIVFGFSSTGKVEVECIWAVLKAFDEAEAGPVLVGYGADELHGTTRGGLLSGWKDPVAMTRHIERDCAPPHFQDEVVAVYGGFSGKQLVTPYRDPQLIECVRGLSYCEMHKPLEKAIARLAWRDFLKGSGVRRHCNFYAQSTGIGQAFDGVASRRGWSQKRAMYQHLLERKSSLPVLLGQETPSKPDLYFRFPLLRPDVMNPLAAALGVDPFTAAAGFQTWDIPLAQNQRRVEMARQLLSGRRVVVLGSAVAREMGWGHLTPLVWHNLSGGRILVLPWGPDLDAEGEDFQNHAQARKMLKDVWRLTEEERNYDPRRPGWLAACSRS